MNIIIKEKPAYLLLDSVDSHYILFSCPLNQKLDMKHIYEAK